MHTVHQEKGGPGPQKSCRNGLKAGPYSKGGLRTSDSIQTTREQGHRDKKTESYNRPGVLKTMKRAEGRGPHHMGNEEAGLAGGSLASWGHRPPQSAPKTPLPSPVPMLG